MPNQPGPRCRLATIAGAVTVLALLLAGCGSDDDGSDSPDDQAGATTVDQDSSDDTGSNGLDGREFVSTGVTVSGEPYALADGTVVRLSFSDGQVSASAGCNTMGAPATYDDGTLVTDGQLAMTQMGCDPALMDQDTWLADILASTPSLELEGDTLTLTSEATVITLQDREVAEPDVALTGTRWSLESLGNTGADGAISSVPLGVTSTLRISEGGELALEPGCNTGGATVQVTDTTLEIGPIRLTKMFCTPEANQVEQDVLAVLDGTADYQIDSDLLTISNGDRMLVYRAGRGDGQADGQG